MNAYTETFKHRRRKWIVLALLPIAFISGIFFNQKRNSTWSEQIQAKSDSADYKLREAKLHLENAVLLYQVMHNVTKEETK